MSRYLEEAAALLRDAKKNLEARDAQSTLDLGGFNKERQALAQGFATLAAIDKGLLPAEITQDVIRAITEHPAA